VDFRRRGGVRERPPAAKGQPLDPIAQSVSTPLQDSTSSVPDPTGSHGRSNLDYAATRRPPSGIPRGAPPEAGSSERLTVGNSHDQGARTAAADRASSHLRQPRPARSIRSIRERRTTLPGNTTKVRRGAILFFALLSVARRPALPQAPENSHLSLKASGGTRKFEGARRARTTKEGAYFPPSG
jgi:hypothetical protein